MKPTDTFPKHHYYLLIFIWLIVSILFLIYHGPRTMYDSHQYMGRAQELLNGEWVGFRYFWYVGYIGFLVLLKWISNDVVLWSVVLQVLISGIAAIYVYKLTLLISENKWAAFVATLLFICWYKIQVWNYFVLTESLFISLLVILFYAILKHQYKWQVWVLLILVLFIRPTGLIVCIATVITLMTLRLAHLNIRYRWMGILVVIIVSGLILDSVLGNYGLIEEYSEGKIVYSADRVEQGSLKEGLFVHSDQPLDIPEYSDHPILDGFRFFVLNPGYTLELIGTRIIYFIFDYRPYHSTVHIIVNTILLLICYAFTAIFFVKAKGQKLSKTWFLIFFIGNILMAGFTCLTWEGRFFAPLYPFLFIFSCCGGGIIYQRLNKLSKHRSHFIPG